MSITGSIRIATLAAASLICGATIASSQACPASPSYTPDFTGASPSCFAFNPSGSAYPSFQTGQSVGSTVLRLTPNQGGLATSAWYTTPQNVTAGFSTTFSFQISQPTPYNADGIAFVIQNNPASNPGNNNLPYSLTELGPGGCGIGFGGSSSGCADTSIPGIPNSVAIEFNTFNNGSPVDPNSSNDVAIQSCPGGAANSVDYLSNCNVAFATLNTINLTDGAVHSVTVIYEPSPLTSCGASGSQSCSTLDVIIDGTDIFNGPVLFDMATITSSTAYLGFTAGTGGGSDNQDILSWIYTPPAAFTFNGGFTQGTPTGYNFSAQQTTSNQTAQVAVTQIPMTQQACTALVQQNTAFTGAQCFVYQNGGGPGSDMAVMFAVTCPANTNAQCGPSNNFFADLGTQFSFSCDENPHLNCPASSAVSGGSFGLPHSSGLDGLPAVGFLKGEGPDANNPCTAGNTRLFTSNQIESFTLGDTSGGAKGGSGGTTSCWVMTYETPGVIPTVTVTSPVKGITYAQNSSENAAYTCTAASTGSPNTVPAGPYLSLDPALGGVCAATDSYAGTVANVANNSPFDTGTLGPHTFTAQVQDSAMNSNQTPVMYNVGPPLISGPSSAIFTDGSQSSVTFTAIGYYPVSTFSESGAALPAGVTFVDNGNGTATLSGIATVSAVYPITITAQNGVGSVANLPFTLTTAASLPAAGNKCNGIYDGTFKGNLTVSAGQTCIFVGGGVTGNVVENGGTLILTNAAVGGSTVVNKGTFAIGSGTSIKGNLSILEPPKSAVQSTVCGATIGANLQVLESSTPVAIGNGTAACPGNTITGNLNVSGNNAAVAIYNNAVGGSLLDLANAKPTQVFSNHVKGILSCLADSGITGGSNTASLKLGQCSKF
jgi:hypothetical protein